MSMDELQIGDGNPLQLTVGRAEGFGPAGCNIPFKVPFHFEPGPENRRVKPLIIGFGHEAEQGKDTVVAHLIKTFGTRAPGEWGKYFPLDVRRFAFADPLKIEVFDYLQASSFVLKHEGVRLVASDPDPDRLYTRQEKLDFINEHKVEHRSLLQKWGTEYRRAQRADYWARETQIKIDYDLPQVALITDMRFLNETEICDVRVRVVRTGYTNAVPKHSSEMELSNFAYEHVLEAASVPELEEKGEKLFEEILLQKGLIQ